MCGTRRPLIGQVARLHGARNPVDLNVAYWMYDGQPGSNTVSTDGEALDRFATEGLRICGALVPVLINSLRPDREIAECHSDDFAVHLPQRIIQF